MADITLYYSKTCPVCKKLIDYLEENDIAYEGKEVTTDKDALKEMVEKTGESSVPQIEINGKIISGFDKEELEKELKNV